jgi:hypothetical protein
MDMGMTVLAGMDPKVISFFLSFFVDIIPTGILQEALKNFLEAKISNLSDIESRCIALNERKERILAEISQFKV